MHMGPACNAEQYCMHVSSWIEKVPNYVGTEGDCGWVHHAPSINYCNK